MESPESWFHRRATHYVEAQILFHLNQAGVLQALRRQGPCTAAEVAQTLDLDPAITDALLDYVFGIDDLLDRNDAGQYSISVFGDRVLARYSDSDGDEESRSINMFDVRVGAYGPVWQRLGGMLKKEVRHGIDFHREGRFAEKGVTKLAHHFLGTICETADRLEVGAALEIGTTTGLLGQLAERRPHLALYGLDRNQRALDATKEALHLAHCDARLLQADFFNVSDWTENIKGGQPGLIFSLHFHEIIAKGVDRLAAALRELRQRLPGWVVLALEQPRLPQSERSSLQETLWLYGQSNILIHHLIGNGRILSREDWVGLGKLAGCEKVTDTPCGYLGYRAFAFYL
ncbi:MAG: class I SAM-dependent methyltransferase [Pseudomonadota bacterium]